MAESRSASAGSDFLDPELVGAESESSLDDHESTE